MSNAVNVNTWRTVVRSQTGPSHESTGAPCQDAAAAFRRGQTLYLALADGAGSARLAKLGAETAVRNAILWLQKNTPSPTDGNWPAYFRQAVRFVHAALEQTARTHDSSIKELACTLLIAVITPKGAICGHIGDGACVLRFSPSRYRTLSASPAGGPANRTSFVTDANYLNLMRVAVCRGAICGVAAFSDGLEAGALDAKRDPHRGFFDPLFGWCDEKPLADASQLVADFLRSDRLRSHTDDDCTLILAAL